MFAELAKQMLTNGLLQHASNEASARSAGMGYYALAGMLGIIALIFLSIAVYGLLLTLYPVPVAAAIVGGAALVLAAISIVAGKSMTRRQAQPRVSEQEQMLGQFIDEAIDGLIADCEDPIRENPKTALLLAGVAGLLAGNRLH